VNKMSLQLKAVTDRNAALEAELKRRDAAAAPGGQPQRPR
jgi:hypothetical protein